MQKWEYNVFLRTRLFTSGGEPKAWNVDLGLKLAELGEQGWELVSVVPRCDGPIAPGATTTIGATTSELWVFKRSKDD